MQTYTHADVYDGLCCFLINSSHADWIIHLITGCIDSLGSHREREKERCLGWDRQASDRQKGQSWSDTQQENCIEKQSRQVVKSWAQTHRKIVKMDSTECIHKSKDAKNHSNEKDGYNGFDSHTPRQSLRWGVNGKGIWSEGFLMWSASIAHRINLTYMNATIYTLIPDWWCLSTLELHSFIASAFFFSQVTKDLSRHCQC